MPRLSLYYMPTCPYCRKVLDYLEKNNISVELKNTTTNSEIREELLKAGGKSQVPCLLIDGKALYESDDIIRWLKENLYT